MKSLFNYFKALSLALLAVAAVSCEDPIEETPKVEDLLLQLESNDIFFEAGETKTVTVAEGQAFANPTFETPEGWTVVADAASLAITAPSQESVDGGSAVAYGTIDIKVTVGVTDYVATLGVYMGSIIAAESISATFNDVQVKVIITGVEEYMMYLGTDGAWKESFDEWQASQDNGMEPKEFGWAGEYFGVFEGSLFDFARNPFKPDYAPLPDHKYELAILPMVDGKAVKKYTYSDVKLFTLPTAEAGENGKVVPTFALDDEKTTHSQVYVNISAPDAYITFYSFYREQDYEDIGGREQVIKKNLITQGSTSTEDTMVASWTAMQPGQKLYLAAFSLDMDGNYGQLVIQEFSSKEFLFNEDLKVTLGEITCSEDGKTVYIPVSTTGGEVDYYRYAYIPSSVSAWNTTYGGTIEKAEVYVASVPNQYYGPKFVYPEDLVNGEIVVSGAGGPYPGTMARILVLAMDANGVPSRAAYAEYTPTENTFAMIESDQEGYEFGMPTVTYKDVTTEVKNGIPCVYANFNVTLAEGTETAWVCVAGEEYLDGRSATDLVKEMIDDEYPFMKTKKFTANGVFNGDSMYAVNTEDSIKAVFVTWLDTNGKYHETKLMYEPIEDAQADLKAAGA